MESAGKRRGKRIRNLSGSAVQASSRTPLTSSNAVNVNTNGESENPCSSSHTPAAVLKRSKHSPVNRFGKLSFRGSDVQEKQGQYVDTGSTSRACNVTKSSEQTSLSSQSESLTRGNFEARTATGNEETAQRSPENATGNATSEVVPRFSSKNVLLRLQYFQTECFSDVVRFSVNIICEFQ